MRYLERRFSVPAAGPGVTQEDWDRIFSSDDPAPENPVGSSEKSGRLKRLSEEIKEEVASWPEEVREQLDKDLATKSYSGRPLTKSAERGSIIPEEEADA